MTACTAATTSPAALMELGWRDRARVLRDMWNFIVLYKEFKWGRQIMRAAMQRPYDWRVFDAALAIAGGFAAI